MENRFQFIADPAYEEAIYYIVLTLILTSLFVATLRYSRQVTMTKYLMKTSQESISILKILQLP